jgi:F-type H+-transporting ATPase subunit b
MTVLLAASEDSGGGSFLVSPSLGLMIWTLLAFAITLYLLNKLAFPRIAAALDRRRVAIQESIDAAQRAKQEADELLEEYRARLREAREQAEEIVARSRKAAESVADETSCWRARAATSSRRRGGRSRSCARRSRTSPSWPPRRSPASR